MWVYIVLRNGEVDEVFTNFEAALEHSKALRLRWSLTRIVAREVKPL